MVIKTEPHDHSIANPDFYSDPDWRPGGLCKNKKAQKRKKSETKLPKSVQKNHTKKRKQEKPKSLTLIDNLQDEVNDLIAKDEGDVEKVVTGVNDDEEDEDMRNSSLKSEILGEMYEKMESEMDHSFGDFGDYDKLQLDGDIKNGIKKSNTGAKRTESGPVKYSKAAPEKQQSYETITPETAHLPKYNRSHKKAIEHCCEVCSEHYKGYLGYARLLCHQKDKHQIPIKVRILNLYIVSVHFPTEPDLLLAVFKQLLKF